MRGILCIGLVICFTVGCLLITPATGEMQIWSTSTVLAYETTVRPERECVGRDQESRFDFDARMYSEATLEDNFCGSSLLVVLNRETTFNHLSSFDTLRQNRFSGVNAYSISELTSLTREVVYLQRVERRMHSFRYAGGIQDEPIVEDEDFRSIVRITLNIDCRENVLRYIRLLKRREYILYVGPNFIHEIVEDVSDRNVDDCTIETNIFEPLSKIDWNMLRTNAPQAHRIATGLGGGVTVGIIDTGIDGTHPSLIPNLNNHLHRVFQGGRMSSISVPNDSGNHGTRTAGVVRKVAPNANLVSLRVDEVRDGNIVFFSDNVILAVNHATANGIDILNYSARARCRVTNTAPFNDPALAHAINLFPGLFVAGAGNDNRSNDTTPF